MNLFKENPNTHQGYRPLLVVPVNCEGVMGKGMAKEAKFIFRQSSKFYMDSAYVHMRGGDIQVCFEQSPPVKNSDPYEGVIFLASKELWKRPSKMEWIERGVINLREFLDEYVDTYLYIPPIGAGLGGLHSAHVEYVVNETLRNHKSRYLYYDPRREPLK